MQSRMQRAGERVVGPATIVFFSWLVLELGLDKKPGVGLDLKPPIPVTKNRILVDVLYHSILQCKLALT
jgi:hypothetical protein